MRDEMKVGDPIFFYHSNCKEPGIVGLAKVSSKPYTDHTAFDPDCHYFDAKSDPENPRWIMVDITYERHLKRNISLQELKQYAELEGFRLVSRGNRLSIMPVTKTHWDFILGQE